MIYCSVTIDTECDKGPQWLLKRPLAFSAVIEGIPDRIEPVLKRFGAKGTYFLSPEVIQDDRSVQTMRVVKNLGAELGTHLHGEFIEPESRPECDGTWEMQNIYPPEIEAAKIKNLTKLFEDKFGESPRCFRAGRFGLGRHTLKILSDLGYSVDSSVAPNYAWSDEGGRIAFLGAPDGPYHPDKLNPVKEGDLPIVELPITTGLTPIELFPRKIVRAAARYPFAWPFFWRIWKNHFQPVFLRPTVETGTLETMRKLILAQLARSTGRDLYLVMMFHNVDLVPGCSPYARSETDSMEFTSRLHEILNLLQERDAIFCTVSGAIDYFSRSCNAQVSPAVSSTN